jgi:hypothetical protein
MYVFVNILKKIKNFQIFKNKKSKEIKNQNFKKNKKSFLDPQHVISSLNFAR